MIIFSSVQSLSRVRLLVTPQTAAHQASLSTTNSQSLPKLMPSKHLILCRPLLLLPSISPNIRIFSNESALPIRWPKYCSFSFNISPSNEHSRLISFRMDWWFYRVVYEGLLLCKIYTLKYSWVMFHHVSALTNSVIRKLFVVSLQLSINFELKF